MRLHASSRARWAARRVTPLVCALAVGAAVAAPAGAEATTTITSASCVVSASPTPGRTLATFSVAWSGKDPHWYNIFFDTGLLPGRFDDEVPKPNDNSLTVTVDTAFGPALDAIIWLHGKPHGNTEPIWPSLGPLKDRIDIPCT